MEPVRPRARVMIASAGALAAPEVAWSLVDAGFAVFAATPPGRRPALRRAKHVTLVPVEDPRRDADRALEELVAALRRHACDVFLPLDDYTLLLAGELARAAPEVRLPVDPAQLPLALDKSVQIAAAGQAGLHVPPTTVARSREEALAVGRFPAFAKGALAAAREGGRLLRDPGFAVAGPAELRAVVEGWDFARPLLVQPRLRGIGTGIFGLATPDGVRAWSAHRRVRMLNPQGSGSSACEAVEPERALREPVERLLAEVGWRGMFMVELLRDAEGRDWFMELNGRAWGSLALARGQGLEYPAWTVELLLDDAFRPPELPLRPLRARHLGREILHGLAVLRGPRSAAVDDWPSRWRTIASLLRFRRRDRWYNLRRGESGVFWQDAWDTVRDALRRARA